MKRFFQILAPALNFVLFVGKTGKRESKQESKQESKKARESKGKQARESKLSDSWNIYWLPNSEKFIILSMNILTIIHKTIHKKCFINSTAIKTSWIFHCDASYLKNCKNRLMVCVFTILKAVCLNLFKIFPHSHNARRRCPLRCYE